jgi:hypothetical protein
MLKKVGCGCCDVRVPRYVSCLATAQHGTTAKGESGLSQITHSSLVRLARFIIRSEGC